MTPPHLQRLFNQCATIKLLIFIAVLFSQGKCQNLIYGELRYVISFRSYSQLIIWSGTVRIVNCNFLSYYIVFYWNLTNVTSAMFGTMSRTISCCIAGGRFLLKTTAALWTDWTMGFTHRHYSDRIYIHGRPNAARISPHCLH